MSFFKESTWEADAVGDKISTELFQKRNKNNKKDGKKHKSLSKSSVAPSKKDGSKKNFQASNENVRASTKHSKRKVEKRSRSLSNSHITDESPAKKLKKVKTPFKDTVDKDFQSSKISKKHKMTHKNQSKASTVPVKQKPLSSKQDRQLISQKKQNQDFTDKRKVINDKATSMNPITQETKSQQRRKKKKLKEKQLQNDSKTAKDKSLNLEIVQELLAHKEKNGHNKVKNIKDPGSLRDRMMTQLRASRFRFLNETLYNNVSSESKKYFKEDPDAFAAYHSGYRQQVEQWPLNPLDVIISSLKKMAKNLVIADFGCGEARLADSVQQTVHSFDLVAINDKVKACDMAHTPLLTNGVNVVVFCLSLMGTNLADYLLEANRVLKKDGILKIADVESRFDNIDEFIQLLGSYGFTNTWKDLSHNLFYFMDFKKTSEVNRQSTNLPEIVLKPCLYKKR